MNDLKHRKLMTLLGKAGIDNDTRHDMVYSWTSGRTASTKELFDREVDDLIWKITNDFTFRNELNPHLEIERRNKRATVLAIAGRVGFFPNGSSNFETFNSFMLSGSILKMHLGKYKLDELDQLIKQFRAIEKNYDKSAEQPGTKAWHHKNKLPKAGDN